MAGAAALLPGARLSPGQGQRSGAVLDDVAGTVAAGAFEALNALAIPVGIDLIRTNEHAAGTGLGGAFYVYDEDVDEDYVAANPCTSKISSNGRGFRLSLDQPISASMCGAVGDGIADDTAAFLAAIATGVGTIHVPSGYYRITGMLELDGQTLLGEGRLSAHPAADADFIYAGGTHIFADAAMIAVIKVQRTGGIRHAAIDAAGEADYAVLMSNCGVSELLDVRAINAKYDCIYFAPVGNNNNASVRNCWIRRAGHGTSGYHTGTAAYTNGSQTVTFTGAADLTTLGIREYKDFLYVAGRAYRIGVHTATTMTVWPPLSSTATGQPYEIAIGSGIMVTAYGDNSQIKSTNNMIQVCPAAGIHDQALYGVMSTGDTIEACGYAHAIGIAGTVTTLSSRSLGLYTEGGKFGYYMVESALGPVFEPNIIQDGLLEGIYFPSPTFVAGVQYRTYRGNFAGERVYHINPTVIDAELGSAYVVNATGAHTINLPAMTGDKASLARKLDFAIIFVFEAVSGTATFKSPDATVNGVAGATGITHTGDYTRREARYTSSGWTVTP